MKGGPFALSFSWPDLVLVVLVVSVKSGPFSVRCAVWRTRRERLKSALYPRLKKRKPFKTVKGGRTIRLFQNPVCCKISNKLKVGPFEGKKKFEKKSYNAEKK